MASTPALESEAEASKTYCHACEKAYSKYSCPKCGSKLCSLECYERHNDGRCRSTFHEDNLADAMRGLTATEDTRKAMMETLRRRAAEDGVLDLGMSGDDKEEGDEEEGAEDEDAGERCVLSEASLERLRLGDELDLSMLNEEERAMFERACASGELIEPWMPWWELEEASQTRVGARGARAVAELSEMPTASTSTSGAIPPLASENELLDPFEALCQGKDPPEVLRWHCVNALAAYALVKRVFNGDWSDEEAEASAMLLYTSVVLSSRTPIADVQCASSALHDVICRAAASPPGAAPVPPPAALTTAVTTDAAKLFSGGPSSTVRAFLDLIRVFNAARDRKPPLPKDARASASAAERKCRYLASYLASALIDRDGVATDVTNRLRGLVDEHRAVVDADNVSRVADADADAQPHI